MMYSSCRYDFILSELLTCVPFSLAFSRTIVRDFVLGSFMTNPESLPDPWHLLTVARVSY